MTSGNERLTVYLSVIIMQFVCFLNYTRCIEKSRFGAVTFDKCVVLSVHVQKFEWAQIGEGV